MVCTHTRNHTLDFLFRSSPTVLHQHIWTRSRVWIQREGDKRGCLRRHPGYCLKPFTLSHVAMYLALFAAGERSALARRPTRLGEREGGRREDRWRNDDGWIWRTRKRKPWNGVGLSRNTKWINGRDSGNGRQHDLRGEQTPEPGCCLLLLAGFLPWMGLIDSCIIVAEEKQAQKWPRSRLNANTLFSDCYYYFIS